MGAVVNLAPSTFAGIVAQVPFVDALNSILDPSLPLTVTEWESGRPTARPCRLRVHEVVHAVRERHRCRLPGDLRDHVAERHPSALPRACEVDGPAARGGLRRAVPAEDGDGGRAGGAAGDTTPGRKRRSCWPGSSSPRTRASRATLARPSLTARPGRLSARISTVILAHYLPASPDGRYGRLGDERPEQQQLTRTVGRWRGADRRHADPGSERAGRAGAAGAPAASARAAELWSPLGAAGAAGAAVVRVVRPGAAGPGAAGLRPARRMAAAQGKGPEQGYGQQAAGSKATASRAGRPEQGPRGSKATANQVTASRGTASRGTSRPATASRRTTSRAAVRAGWGPSARGLNGSSRRLPFRRRATGVPGTAGAVGRRSSGNRVSAAR